MLFGTIDTFLIWRLTGGKVHVTDVSNASRTLLFNIHTLRVGRRAADAARRAAGDAARGASRRARSTARPIRSCSARRSRSPATPAISRRRSFGQACFEPGTAKNTYGTGCFMLLNTGDEAGAVGEGPADDGGLEDRRQDHVRARRARCSSPARRCSGCATGSKAIEASADVETLMSEVPDTDGVYLVPAFVGLGAPYWDPRARGVDRRPDAQHHDGARRARRGRRDGLSDARRARGDAARIEAAADDAQGRWRRLGQRDAAAVPGRPAERDRAAAGRRRDDGARRRVSRRTGRRATGTAWTM